MNIRYILLSLCLFFTSLAAMDSKAINRKLQVDMLSTIMNAPYVLALDSQDSDHIKIAAAVDALAHAIKAANLYNVAHQSEDQKAALWDMLKIGAHISVSLDSMNKTMNSEEIAKINKKFRRKLRSHKVNQMMQLAMEAGLRGVSFYNHNNGEEKTSAITSEVADIVGLLRMMNRTPVLTSDNSSDVSTDDKQEELTTEVKTDADIQKSVSPAVENAQAQAAEEAKEVEQIVERPQNGFNPHLSIIRYVGDEPNASWPQELSETQIKGLIKRNKKYNFDEFECRATQNVLQYPIKRSR